MAREALESAGRAPSFAVLAGDTTKSLGDLALSYRKRFDIPVVAVTGSNGKTTAKEMIERVLRRGWSPIKNTGTQNNLIGVPLTVFKLRPSNKSAVIELGMNRFGEIKRLAGIVRPNIGLVTNIGPAHLEHLGSLEGVYSAKRELLDSLGAGDIAVLNNDDNFLRRFRRKAVKIVTYGVERDSDFRAEDIKRTPAGWRFGVSGRLYDINVAARHDVYNALAAIAVGRLFDISCDDIRAALRDHTSLEKRMAVNTYRGVEFIDDTYNSNPLSLEAAVRTLAGCETRGRRILVSGDMLELGKMSGYYHGKIGRIVAGSRIDDFIAVGELARKSFLAAKRSGMKNAWSCASSEEAAEVLRNIARPEDIVLVKGSRARRMEDVIRCFTTSFTR